MSTANRQPFSARDYYFRVNAKSWVKIIRKKIRNLSTIYQKKVFFRRNTCQARPSYQDNKSFLKRIPKIE